MILFRRKHEKIREASNHNATDNQRLSNIYQPDLECEEAIMHDKQRFGRVRTNLMKYLRAKYGQDTANRAMWRINKREIKPF